jgi:hypothetical protein
VLSIAPTYGLARPVIFLLMLFCGFLVIVFVRQVGTSAARGRWWVLGIVLTIFVLRLIHLRFFLAPAGMGPSEQLQWDRWYLLPVDAAYNTGAAIIVWKILAALVRVIWRGLRAVIARFRPERTRPPATEPVPS